MCISILLGPCACPDVVSCLFLKNRARPSISTLITPLYIDSPWGGRVSYGYGIPWHLCVDLSVGIVHKD